MLDNFSHLIPFTKDEIGELWKTAEIVVDTNILLHLYRFDSAGRDELFKALNRPVIRKRLFIPHQVAHEFFSDRASVIASNYAERAQLASKTQKVFGDLQAAFASIHKYHPFVRKAEWENRFRQTEVSFLEELNRTPPDYPPSALTDPILPQILDLIGGSIGEPLEAPGTAQDEARKRYAAKLPPGYMDLDKPEPERFGDYFIWLQMIARAKEKACGAIFVTDDTKEDWWLHVKGQRLGARPELRREFLDETGHRLLIVDYQAFVLKATELAGEQLSEIARKDLTDRSTEIRRAERDKVAVTCVSCDSAVEALLGVVPGETAHATCQSCAVTFMIHRAAGGSVIIGGRSPGAAVVSYEPCASCGKSVFVRLPIGRETTFLATCDGCGTHLKVTGSANDHRTEDLGRANAKYHCPHCGNDAAVFVSPGRHVRFIKSCPSCHGQVSIEGTLESFQAQPIT